MGTSWGFLVGRKQCGDFMGFLSRMGAVWELQWVSYWDGSSMGTSWGFLVGWKQCGDFMGFLSGMEAVWGLHGVS